MSTASGRLVQQTADEWAPLVMDYVAVLDRSTQDLTTSFGWTWAEGEEAGVGTMRYVGLAYDGRSRFVLIASVEHPERGIALEAAQDEDPAQERADFLAALGLAPDVFLSIREGASCFSRSARAPRGSSASTPPRRRASAARSARSAAALRVLVARVGGRAGSDVRRLGSARRAGGSACSAPAPVPS